MSWSENHWLVDPLPVFKPILSVILLHSEFQKCSQIQVALLCVFGDRHISIQANRSGEGEAEGTCISLEDELATSAHVLPARTESCDQSSLQGWLWNVFLPWILLLIESRVGDYWAQLVTTRSPYRLWNESRGQGKSFAFYSEGCRNHNCVSQHNFCVKNTLEGALVGVKRTFQSKWDGVAGTRW